MALHIRKLCVGADRIDDLAAWQARRLRAGRGEEAGRIWHATRNWPRRQAEVLDEAGEGVPGSLYWIIRGQMTVRQRILGFEPEPTRDPDEKPLCRILLDPALVPTEPWPHRPFQGWRYLEPAEAPPDIDFTAGGEDLPPDLAAELKALGAW